MSEGLYNVLRDDTRIPWAVAAEHFMMLKVASGGLLPSEMDELDMHLQRAAEMEKEAQAKRPYETTKEEWDRAVRLSKLKGALSGIRSGVAGDISHASRMRRTKGERVGKTVGTTGGALAGLLAGKKLGGGKGAAIGAGLGALTGYGTGKLVGQEADVARTKARFKKKKAEIEKQSGLEQPDLPRARDVIKGRGPEARAAREALRKRLRSTCPIKTAAKMSQERREDLPSKAFAVPVGKAEKIGVEGEIKGEAKGKYPIPDLKHARNALARVSQHGTPAEREAVRKKVYAKFPELKEGFKERHGGESPTEKEHVKKVEQGGIGKSAAKKDDATAPIAAGAALGGVAGAAAGYGRGKTRRAVAKKVMKGLRGVAAEPTAQKFEAELQRRGIKTLPGHAKRIRDEFKVNLPKGVREQIKGKTREAVKAAVRGKMVSRGLAGLGLGALGGVGVVALRRHLKKKKKMEKTAQEPPPADVPVTLPAEPAGPAETAPELAPGAVMPVPGEAPEPIEAFLQAQQAANEAEFFRQKAEEAETAAEQAQEQASLMEQTMAQQQEEQAVKDDMAAQQQIASQQAADMASQQAQVSQQDAVQARDESLQAQQQNIAMRQAMTDFRQQLMDLLAQDPTQMVPPPIVPAGPAGGPPGAPPAGAEAPPPPPGAEGAPPEGAPPGGAPEGAAPPPGGPPPGPPGPPPGPPGPPPGGPPPGGPPGPPPGGPPPGPQAPPTPAG